MDMNKLIIIDDNPLEHFIAGKLLKESGCFNDIKHFMDGQESIDFVEKNLRSEEELPDMIILDLNMPGLNGRDFLKQFKQMRNTMKKNICVNILSSSVYYEDMMLPESYDFVKAYYIKPLSPQMIKEMQQQCIN
jgi:CheY-like chemotaxis protein